MFLHVRVNGMVLFSYRQYLMICSTPADFILDGMSEHADLSQGSFVALKIIFYHFLSRPHKVV